MFVQNTNDDERRETARGLFRKYDDHGDRTYRKWVICQILDLVTQDEIGAVGRLHWQILEHFYRRNRATSQIAGYLMLREQDVATYKTQAIKRLRGLFESPRNDWHRLVVVRPAIGQATFDEATDPDGTSDDAPVESDPHVLWGEYDSTTAYSQHRRIISCIIGGTDEASLAQIPTVELQALQCYAAGKTDAQSAIELGCAKQTYRVRKARAIERLRSLTLGISGDQVEPAEDDAEDVSEPEPEQESRPDLSAVWDECTTTSSYSDRRKIVEQVFSLLDTSQLIKLSVQDITVLVLYIRGCTEDEMAAVLGQTKPVARNAKYDAIERLKGVSLGQNVSRPVKDTNPKSVRSRTHHAADASSGKESDEDTSKADDTRIPSVLKNRKYPKSEREAAVLAYCADRTNSKLRNKVVEMHFSKVNAIAYKYTLALHGAAEHEELVCHGLIGLAEAMGKYDPAREGAASFDTYADYCIKGEILDQWKADSGKRTQISALERLLKKEKDGEALSREDEELKEFVQQIIFGAWALDQPRDADSNTSLLDVIQDTALTPEYALLEAENVEEQQQTRDRIVELFSGLPWKWRIVIEQRLIHDKSFAEAGQLAGMSESWACRIYRKALEAVQEMARQAHLRFPPSLL